MDAHRAGSNPIVTEDIGDGVGETINGPSLVRTPDWASETLGTYCLYFAGHAGNSIRLATSDCLTGPWELQPPALKLKDAGEGFDDHIASPDVHVGDDEQFRMYYDGCCVQHEDATGSYSQFTRVATSEDGVSYTAWEEPLGRFYFRVFEYQGAYFALAKENRGKNQTTSGQRVYRSNHPTTGFEPGPLLFRDGSRHTAVRRREDTLDVFYSRIGDAPERILYSTVDLSEPWPEWEATEPQTVVQPEYEWEGTDRPVEPSGSGIVTRRVNQLRDPALFQDGQTTYLLYTVAGEQGIALAELIES